MSAEPVVAFGQQPCGFFPRRFLVAKIRTARRLQAELGGRVVYFCHDSDHDPRETRTLGVARRGAAIRASTLPMYANPGMKPSMNTRYGRPACSAITSAGLSPDAVATLERSGAQSPS